MAFDPRAYLAGGGTQGKAKKFDPKAYLGAKPAPDLPLLNPHTGMPLDTSPDEVTAGDLRTGDTNLLGEDMDPATKATMRATQVSRGRHQMTPEEERSMNAGMVGGAVGTGASLLLGPYAGGVGGRLAVAALSNAAAGEASGGLRAAQEGKSGADIADAAAEEGSMGALAGPILHGAGEVGGKVADKLIGAKGWVGRFLRAKAAGVYDTPEMQALPEGQEGVNAAAHQGHQRISNKLQANRAARSEAYAGALNPPGPKPGAPLSREQAIIEAAPDRPEQNALLAAARGVDAPPLTQPTARESLLSAARGVDAPQPAPKALPGGYEPAPGPPQAWPAEGLSKPVDREGLIANLRAQQAKNINPDTGRPFNAEVDAMFNKAIVDLGPEGTTNTVEGVLGQRKALGETANFGNPIASTTDKAAQRAYRGLRSSIRETAPEIGAADDAYAASANKDARARELIYKSDAEVATAQPHAAATEPAPGSTVDPADELFGAREPPPEPGSPEAKMAVLKEQQGVRNLERIGDTESKPGREYQRYLEELAQQDPEFRAALDFIGAKSGYEATRFGLHSHMPTHLGRATQPLFRIGMQNLDALAARGIYPGAQAVGNLRLAAPFSGTVADQLLNAKAEGKSKDKKRADALGNR